MTPSTPRRSSFPRTERSLTVQASTATPREWQRSTAARVMSRWSSVVAATSASPRIASMRNGRVRRRPARTGPTTGTKRRLPTPSRLGGYVRLRVEPPQRLQLAETVGAGHRSPDEVVPPQGFDELPLVPASLHVRQEPGLGAL